MRIPLLRVSETAAALIVFSLAFVAPAEASTPEGQGALEAGVLSNQADESQGTSAMAADTNGVSEEESMVEGAPESTGDRDHYKMPELLPNEEAPVTRNFGLGVGTMGGYGLAALNIREKIPTGARGLPWVGLELGGGWTPPGAYQLLVGPVGDVDDEDNKWRIISGAGAVLLYFHRWHYLPVRTGWDVGRGVYFMLGYGFEHLNLEGFFSWGVEAGILYQPFLEDNIERLVDCGPNTECGANEMWPVIPYVRFSLHFYLV